MMAKKVRRNQQILDRVFYNGDDMLIVKESRPWPDSREVRDTIVILCNGHLKIGSFYDARDNYTAYFVLGHDSGMRWERFNRFFPTASVIKVFLKMGVDSQEVVKTLSKFVVNLSKNSKGRVILNNRLAELIGGDADDFEVVSI